MFILQKVVLVSYLSNTHRSFIGMDVTGKYYINFVLNEPRLKHYPHGFSFHVMIVVTVIPRGMQKNN